MERSSDMKLSKRTRANLCVKGTIFSS